MKQSNEYVIWFYVIFKHFPSSRETMPENSTDTEGKVKQFKSKAKTIFIP